MVQELEAHRIIKLPMELKMEVLRLLRRKECRKRSLRKITVRLKTYEKEREF